MAGKYALLDSRTLDVVCVCCVTHNNKASRYEDGGGGGGGVALYLVGAQKNLLTEKVLYLKL